MPACADAGLPFRAIPRLRSRNLVSRVFPFSDIPQTDPETGETWWMHVQGWFSDPAHRASRPAEGRCS